MIGNDTLTYISMPDYVRRGKIYLQRVVVYFAKIVWLTIKTNLEWDNTIEKRHSQRSDETRPSSLMYK